MRISVSSQGLPELNNAVTLHNDKRNAFGLEGDRYASKDVQSGGNNYSHLNKCLHREQRLSERPRSHFRLQTPHIHVQLEHLIHMHHIM